MHRNKYFIQKIVQKKTAKLQTNIIKQQHYKI